jgi:MFS family permease
MPEKKQPFHNLILLILAGEAIFILPFVLARVFRPTFLDVFQLNNLELGICFSIYGIVAMISYIFGGIITDLFKPKVLMSSALLLTALGGLVMSTYPSYGTMKILFGYWGFTTIFLFWAAMIKSTRIWGGAKKQGLAFGFLDGGRGLVAAGFGSLGILIFSSFMDNDPMEATLEHRKYAFRIIILVSSFLVALIGLLVYIFMRVDTDSTKTKIKISNKTLLDNLKFALGIKPMRLLMIIVLCAYVGYKITDIFSLYAKEVMGYDEIQAAQVGAFLLYIRPIEGIGIGLLADRS